VLRAALRAALGWAAAGLLAAAGAAPAVAGPARLDLLALHERALRQAPALLGAEAAREEQAARLRAAGARLGPQLDAQFEALGQRPAAAAAAADRAAVLQLSQPLVDGAAWAGRAAERQRLAVREAELAAAAQQLRVDSARLYVQWQAQARLHQAQQALARAYAEESTRMGIRHREGLAAAVDWRQSQSYQWLTEAQAQGAEQQLRALRQALAAHAGDTELLRAALAALRPGALPPPRPAAEPGGSTARLEALRREHEAREHELEAARRAAWPRLDLQAQARRDAPAAAAGTTQAWQLQLRLPLWDSGSRAAAHDAAAARHRAAAAVLREAEREQQREAATQRERLQSAREQHATAQGALSAAAQTVAAMRVGQEQGSRSTGDVLLALQTEAQLRQLLVAAQSNAWLAWIEGLAAEGRFDEAALRTLNTELETP
jgi:outer membrane protein